MTPDKGRLVLVNSLTVSKREKTKTGRKFQDNTSEHKDYQNKTGSLHNTQHTDETDFI